MNYCIHVENIKTGMVHLGRVEYGYRHILDSYVAVCGGRSDSEYRLTDRMVECQRCIKRMEKNER